MIIIQRINYEGEDLKADLEKLDEVHSRIQKKVGGKIDGPYFPQSSDLLYIFHVEQYEWLNKAGRLWYKEMAKKNLPFTPVNYEVAVTPKEFFG